MPSHRLFNTLFAAVLAAPVPALAQAAVTVSEPWVRGTVTGQKATGAYMALKAASEAKLVSAASPVAKIVEIHEMAMTDGVMRMRAIDALALPAGKAVELKPGGYHVMLIDLVKPLSPGEQVPITLTVLDADGKKSTIDVKAVVRELASQGSAHKHH
jgi:hypothetical protein